MPQAAGHAACGGMPAIGSHDAYMTLKKSLSLRSTETRDRSAPPRRRSQDSHRPPSDSRGPSTRWLGAEGGPTRAIRPFSLSRKEARLGLNTDQEAP